jgi:ABC-type glycerol-3-phosphate transport system substrate-binding protein
MNRALLGGCLAAVAALVAVPAIVAPRDADATAPAERSGHAGTVVIITPHNDQLRTELARGFARWHRTKFGTEASVAWSVPGGTSEIRRMLVAQYENDLRTGDPPGGAADLVFGGGSYEYTLMAKPIALRDGDRTLTTTILEPVDFTQDFLDAVYGPNDIGGRRLYDPGHAWFGVALSTFGMVWNERILDSLDVPAPDEWADLADPALAGFVGMVNPAQSGSVATVFETILLRLGWDDGWAVLRRACANSNTCTASSQAVPLLIASGQCGASIAIDFYGRFQQQALAVSAQRLGKPELDRLRFAAPPGQTVVDPDPIAMLRGAPHPELARRFIEFALSRDGQALWQFPPGQPPCCGLSGPTEHALRRLPASRSIYSECGACFIDQGDPFADASALPNQPLFRPFVAPLFLAMYMDHPRLLADAWRAIRQHPAYPRTPAGGRAPLVRAADVSDPGLRTMLELFDAMPECAGRAGASLSLASPADLPEVKAGWLDGGFAKDGLWPEGADPRERARMLWSAQCRRNYERIIEMGRTAVAPGMGTQDG